MPRLTRFFVRASLAYLVLSLILAALLLAGQAFHLPSAVVALQPGYFHLFMVGWVTQLIFGMAWWMFPPLSREKPRGEESLAWFVFGALNIGLILRAVAEPLHALQPGGMWAAWLVLSALLQVAAGWTFALILWPRVKGPSGR